MTDAAISVSNVSKQYYLYKRPIHRVLETFHPFGHKYHTSFDALSNVDFQVRRGESVGIIGRNGSGKSTLLQVICGNLQPTGGQVQVNGRISALLELGAGFNPEFTGRENVYLSTAILGLSRQETDARFGQITDFADIGEFIDRPVKMYSSGMYIRLAFATAISVDPDILIVDEALSVGDIFFQQKCVERMKEMVASCTIVLVSHDMHAVSNLCDRVFVLDHGKTLFDGRPMDGIALYTKLMHDERFGGKSGGPSGSDEPSVPEEGVLFADQNEDFLTWLPVPDDKRGGAGKVVIQRVSVTKDLRPFKTVQCGEEILVRMLVSASESISETIFGYTIKDRVGVALFGENSLCLVDKIIELDKGYSLIEYSFVWPEVYPEEYTMTLGIGEGVHPLVHTIQCWAHNIISFSAVTPDIFVHGIFNNPLQRLSVTPLQPEKS